MAVVMAARPASAHHVSGGVWGGGRMGTPGGFYYRPMPVYYGAVGFMGYPMGPYGYGYDSPPPPTLAMPPPPFRPQLGIEASGLSGSIANAENQPVGGAQVGLRYRAERDLTLELSYGQATGSDIYGTTLRDRPLLAATYVYLFGRVVAPYIVLAGGYDTQRLEISASSTEQAHALLGQAGLGLELRLGRHLALDGDFRWVARHDLDRQMPLVLCQQGAACNSVADPQLGSESGVQGMLGAALYF